MAWFQIPDRSSFSGDSAEGGWGIACTEQSETNGWVLETATRILVDGRHQRDPSGRRDSRSGRVALGISSRQHQCQGTGGWKEGDHCGIARGIYTDLIEPPGEYEEERKKETFSRLVGWALRKVDCCRKYIEIHLISDRCLDLFRQYNSL